MDENLKDLHLLKIEVWKHQCMARSELEAWFLHFKELTEFHKLLLRNYLTGGGVGLAGRVYLSTNIQCLTFPKK